MGNNHWKCQCGHLNEPEFTICLLCGRSKSQAAQQVEKPASREITQPVRKAPEQKTPSAKPEAEVRQWAGQRQRFSVDQTISRLGKIDWKIPLTRKPPPAPVGDLSPAETLQLVENFVTASDETVDQFADLLLKKRPAQASSMLLKHVMDKDFPDELRQRAVLMLGNLGDKNVIPTLLKLKRELPAKWLSIALSIALGNLADPAAIPLLLEDQKRYGADVVLKTVSLVALGQIGNPTVLPRIALDCTADSFSDLEALTGKTAAEHIGGKVVDSLRGVQTSGLGSALKLANMAVRKNQLNRMITWVMPYLVNDEISLDVIRDTPGEIRKGWMYKTRISVIMSMCANVPAAYQDLAKAIPQAQSLNQRLILSIAASVFDPIRRDQWINHIVDISQKGSQIEKILAHDALIRFEEYSAAAVIFRGANPTITAAVASSVIMLQSEPLLEQAFALVNSPTVDIRMALIPAIVARATNHQDPKAMVALEKLKNDSSDDIQEALQRYLNGGVTNSEALVLELLSGPDNETRQLLEKPSKPEPSASELVHQAPKWSRFRN